MKEIRSAIFVHAGYQQRDTVGSTHLILATVAKLDFFVTNCLDLGKAGGGATKKLGQTHTYHNNNTFTLNWMSFKKTLTTEDTFIGSS